MDVWGGFAREMAEERAEATGNAKAGSARGFGEQGRALCGGAQVASSGELFGRLGDTREGGRGSARVPTTIRSFEGARMSRAGGEMTRRRQRLRASKVAALGLGSVRGGGTIYEGVVVSTCGPKARSGGTRDWVGLGFEFGSGTGKGTALMGRAHLAVRMREGRGERG